MQGNPWTTIDVERENEICVTFNTVTEDEERNLWLTDAEAHVLTCKLIDVVKGSIPIKPEPPPPPTWWDRNRRPIKTLLWITLGTVIGWNFGWHLTHGPMEHWRVAVYGDTVVFDDGQIKRVKFEDAPDMPSLDSWDLDVRRDYLGGAAAYRVYGAKHTHSNPFFSLPEKLGLNYYRGDPERIN